ncbi:MAG: phosphopyruvate hydratase [Clostridia bacterium]|nr:phosphopyruvate hydratase [Clostridia bacterium]
MSTKNIIETIRAREILDSRGNPTVEATVVLEDGSFGTASVPSGASTGKYEAHELRDGDSGRYGGKGVLKAVENINGKICRELKGSRCDVAQIDACMIRMDGTENKKMLGANAMLAVSLAAARAGASYTKMPLYRYIGGISAKKLPHPLMNILNGGAHASNNLDIQEFMIVPAEFGTYSEALRAGVEIYHQLGSLLKADGHTTLVGDEGGFAPNLRSADEAFDYIVRAIEKAGYTTDQVKIAVDAATSEWADGGSYHLPKTGAAYSSAELVKEWERLCSRYPIVSIEDGLGEDDHDGWKHMTDTLGGSIMLVGDDYFVTNPKRLADGIERGCGNTILVKPNQIGTLTETIEVVCLAKAAGYRTILSHRSGETTDTAVADISVALNTGFIKTGAPCRAERTAKYNRLLKIESELGGDAVFEMGIFKKNGISGKVPAEI